MKGKQWVVFLVIFFGFSSLTYAAAANPVEWTETTLIKTLTVDYKNYKDSLKQSRKNFTSEAWAAMDGFLGNYVINLRNDQLSLHPKIVQKGTIVDSGNLSNINYWRINTIITIPELTVTLRFSVIVIQPTQSSFIIESVNVNPI